MEKNTRKDFVMKLGIITIIILIIAIIALLMLKYEVEGETDMPFKISKIIVVSSAEGNQESETDNNWEVDVYQNNDIYIDITKNNKDTEIIKNIIINNFVVNEAPEVGEIVIYKAAEEGSRTFSYAEEDKISEEITFIGSDKTDSKNLEIANQGGLILFRISNNLNEKYISNEEELTHDGSLISKIEKTNEDIKFKISFDITINLESEKSFKATVNLELPLGDIIENGTESLEKTNMEDIIFKRV